MGPNMIYKIFQLKKDKKKNNKKNEVQSWYKNQIKLNYNG
jgi:hypothetical protein